MSTPRQSEPMQFRKKPVVIEAVQYTEAIRDAYLFDNVPLPAGVYIPAHTIHPPSRTVRWAPAFIDTMEGRMEVSIDDWVITGVKGEHYACKPDIFEMTYEPVASLRREEQGEAITALISACIYWSRRGSDVPALRARIQEMQQAAEGAKPAVQQSAPQAAVPTDPMDWPLPCDVTVGHGTMHKGVKLGTLVARMKVLYKMATGQDADEVANRTPEERQALFEASPLGKVAKSLATPTSPTPAEATAGQGESLPMGAGRYGDADHAAWLADKIVALGDYAKEAAQMLRRWPAPHQSVSAEAAGLTPLYSTRSTRLKARRYDYLRRPGSTTYVDWVDADGTPEQLDAAIDAALTPPQAPGGAA